MTTKKSSVQENSKTLAEALTAFQKEHHAAGRDGKNPFYKSNYSRI